MKTLLIIILATICFVCLFMSIFIAIRNSKTFTLRMKILNSAKGYATKDYLSDSLYYEIIDILDKLKKYNYDKMLYSFKPLKLSSWFTEHEIEIIEKGFTYYDD